MKIVTEIPLRSAMDELLHALTKAQELSWIQLRRHEKKLLNGINQDNSGRIRFHIVGPNGKPNKRVQENHEKIFLLVNDALSHEPSTLDFSMVQDVNGICTNGTRIARCMSEFFKFTKRFKETKNALLLAKCLRQRLWEDSVNQLRQLPGIGMVTVKAFHTSGINSFEKLASADPRHLESITGRRFPYGDQVKESHNTLPPRVDVTIHETGFQVGGKNEYTLELSRITQPKATNKWHMADLIIGDECANHILFYERVSPYPVGVYSSSGVSAALICEEYVGMDILNKIAICIKPKVGEQHEGSEQEKECGIIRILETKEKFSSLERNPKYQEKKFKSGQISCGPEMLVSTSAAREPTSLTANADCPTTSVSHGVENLDRISILSTKRKIVGGGRNVEIGPKTPRVYEEGLDIRSLRQVVLRGREKDHADGMTGDVDVVSGSLREAGEHNPPAGFRTVNEYSKHDTHSHAEARRRLFPCIGAEAPLTDGLGGMPSKGVIRKSGGEGLPHFVGTTAGEKGKCSFSSHPKVYTMDDSGSMDHPIDLNSELEGQTRDKPGWLWGNTSKVTNVESNFPLSSGNQSTFAFQKPLRSSYHAKTNPQSVLSDFVSGDHLSKDNSESTGRKHNTPGLIFGNTSQVTNVHNKSQVSCNPPIQDLPKPLSSAPCVRNHDHPPAGKSLFSFLFD